MSLCQTRQYCGSEGADGNSDIWFHVQTIGFSDNILGSFAYYPAGVLLRELVDRQKHRAFAQEDGSGTWALKRARNSGGGTAPYSRAPCTCSHAERNSRSFA